MADELKHKVVGPSLTQAEFEATDGHIFDSQATGDIVYASSATQLRRLAVGSNDQILTLASGLPSWAASPIVARIAKASDKTITNSDTLEDDADLQFSVLVNSSYLIDLRLAIAQNATPAFKSDISIPSGATGYRLGINDAAAVFADASASNTESTGTVTEAMHTVWYLLITGGTAGTFIFQWSQRTSNAAAVTVKAGSSLLAFKMA